MLTHQSILPNAKLKTVGVHMKCLKVQEPSQVSIFSPSEVTHLSANKMTRLRVSHRPIKGNGMNLRSSLISTFAVSAFAISTLIAAPAAQASTFTYNVDCASGAASLSVTASSGDTIVLNRNAGTCQYVSVEKDIISASTDVTITGGGVPTLVDEGSSFGWTDTSAITQVSIVLTITGPGQINFTSRGFSFGQAFRVSSGGGGSSSSESAVPETFELALNPTDSTSCNTSAETTTGGSWVTLPAADNCTPPATQPNALLLGWSTTPDFPVAIAQRQVDNGWGANEIFNDSGQITAVFIPAGGATNVTGQGNLYAIWKQ